MSPRRHRASFLSGALRFFGGVPWQSTNVSGAFFLGGGSNCYKHEVSFQPDHKLVVGPIYGSPYHQSTKNEQNSMITHPLNLPFAQSCLASGSEMPRSSSSQVSSSPIQNGWLWVLKNFKGACSTFI